MVPTTVDIDADYGPLLLGGLLAFGLSGCVNMQFIVYWQIYSGERWTTKSLVIATWVLDLCHSAFVAVAIWDTIIFSYGDLRRMDTIPWSVGVRFTSKRHCDVVDKVILADSGTNSNGDIPGAKFVLAFIRLGMSGSGSHFMFLTPSDPQELQRYRWLRLGIYAGTVSLCVCGYRDHDISLLLFEIKPLVGTTHESHDRYPHALDGAKWVNHMFRWLAKRTNTTIMSALERSHRSSAIFLGLHFVVGKLYANSLLATLNARHKIRSSQASPFGFLPDTPFTDQCITPRSEQPYAHARTKQMRLDAFTMQTVDLKRKRSIEVNIQRTVEAKYDNGEIDILSVTAESAREVELEPVPPDHIAEV
ncbi:hypothetical protein L210DRAFT_3693220 [Boletus edulis BED1]|uniref:DUF6534 domain-containing protein n=1 Tax=Boletus edulis BED1 TaxID=1328754 RepID=A0AAD4BNW3_BOLED|nr:hypothetical protein L210DRAFT_3693220 [Boletus edulis BED1]